MPLLPAVIGIILNEDQTEVLLVKRNDIPVWVLPGGGIERGEKTEESLVREIYEETGFTVNIIRKCSEYYPVNRLASLTYVFICQIQAGEKCLSSESSDVAFYPLNRLPSTFFPLHATWLQENISHTTLIQRNLTEISYFNFFKLLLKHPYYVMRYALTRLFKT